MSVKSDESGFLGACVVHAEDNKQAHQAVSVIVKQHGHTCSFETLSAPIPASDIPVPPLNRLLSYEELEEWVRDYEGLRELKS